MPGSPQRLNLLISFVVIALIITFGIFIHSGRKVPPLISVRIGLTDTVSNRLFFVASAKHYFAKQGLKTQFNYYDLSDEALTAMEEGDVDLAAAYETPVVAHYELGAPLMIFSKIHFSTQNVGLMAWRNRGITQIHDLKGKRVGLSTGQGTEFFLSLLLKAAGLHQNDVTYVDLDREKLLQAFLDKKIDAAVFWQIDLYRAEKKLNRKEVVVLRSDMYQGASVLVSGQSFGHNHMDTVKRVLAALLQAQDYCRLEMADCKKITVQHLAKLYSADEVDSIWDRLNTDPALNNVLMTIMRMEKDWMDSRGYPSEHRPDIRAIVSRYPLRELRPDMVVIL